MTKEKIIWFATELQIKGGNSLQKVVGIGSEAFRGLAN